jgi:hypothetical protein
MALRDISRRRSNTSGIGGEANVPEHCSTDAIDPKAPPLGDFLSGLFNRSLPEAWVVC